MAHSRSRTRFLSLAMTLPVLAAAAVLAADDQTTDDAAAKVDSKAVDKLKAVNSHLSSLESYETSLKQTLSMRSDFMQDDAEATYTLAVQKPNKLAVLGSGDQGAEIIVSDGEHLFTYVPMLDTYIEEDAPSQLSELLSKVQSESMMLGGGPLSFIGSILGPDALDDRTDFSSATYHGTEQVDGVEVDHMSFVMKPELSQETREHMTSELGRPVEMSYTFDAWVTTGDSPRLHRLKFDLAAMLREMMGPEMAATMPPNMTYEMVMSFGELKTGEDVSQEHFAFKAPEGARKVNSVDELVASAQPADPNDLLGKAAPSFTLEMLDGSSLSPEQHQGRDIVILDFWATWCGPCIQAMPALMEVASEYENRNVVLYAVNQAESNEKVEAFLQQRNWNLKVPMDREGKVANLFNVSGIPQTVIIGKDGTVQAVHVGYSPQLKQQLTSELDRLIAGESLVGGAEDQRSRE